MAWGRVVMVAALLTGASLCACGRSAQPLTTDPSSTSTSSGASTSASSTTSGAAIDPTQPQCHPTYPPPDVSGNQDAEQATLSSDVQVIRSYGERHPDEFTAAGYDTDAASTYAAGWFTEHLDQHRADLERLVAHPDKLRVLQAFMSARDSAALQDEVQHDPQLQGHYNVVEGGTATGIVTVNFFAAHADRDAAAYAHTTWASRLCVTIASHPYPKGAWPDVSVCDTGAGEAGGNAQVDVTLALAHDTTARGKSGTGTATVTNRSPNEITYEGGGNGLGADVVIPSTGQRVGVNSGPQTAIASVWRVGPGQTVQIPVTFGTDDCRADHDYALPAGDYEVRIGGSGNLPPAKARLHVVDD